MVSQSSQVLGFAVGGVLVAVVSARGALALNAATFLGSAVLVQWGSRLRPAAARDVFSHSAGHVRSTAQLTRRLLAKTAAGTRDLRVSEPAIAGPSCLGRRRIRRRARGPGRAVRRSA